MREVTFIKRNQERWQQFEVLISDPTGAEAHSVADAYVQLLDDLAFARSQFPTAQCTTYLNTLSSQVHATVARNKRLRTSRLRMLFFYEIPMQIVGIRWQLVMAALVFISCVVIGFVSGLHDEEFLRSVLGWGYVDMTIENIKSGKPLDVYAMSNPLTMFLRIAANNILILLKTVGLGLLPVVGPAYLLIPNGVMVGAFLGLFARYNHLATANLGIWIHGTLEISAIVVGCAAAINVSKCVLHPGTYPRREAFVRGVRTSVLVVVGMIPLLLVAALLEGFVTRLYAKSVFLNVSIIVASALFVLWYVVVWPRLLLKKDLHERRP